MTSDPSRKVVLREERSGPDGRYLWAYFGPDGALHIDGQDLGPATAPVSADGEYEWFETIRPEHLPRLVELLGGEAGTDLLDLLAERYTGAGAAELERILRESEIPVELFVYSEGGRVPDRGGRLSPAERERLIEAILDHRDEDSFGSGIYGVEVCQLCGKTGTFSGWAAAMGSHFAGEFVPFSHRHDRPDTGPQGGDESAGLDAISRVRELLAERDERYCEVCGQPVRKQEGKRDGHWLCATCEPGMLIRGARRRNLERKTDEELLAWAETPGLA